MNDTTATSGVVEAALENMEAATSPRHEHRLLQGDYRQESKPVVIPPTQKKKPKKYTPESIYLTGWARSKNGLR